MIVVRKTIITDEDHNPIAVQIDYQDRLEIGQRFREVTIKERAVNLSRFAGTMQLTEDPLQYQRRIRDEEP